MAPPTIWINKYLSNTWEVVARVLHEREPAEFRLVVTHPWAYYPGRRYADLFVPEPRGLTDDDYVTWCLQFAADHRVTLFIPGRKLLPVVAAADRFAQIGTNILAAAELRDLLVVGDKIATYSRLDPSDPAIPDYAVARTLGEFLDAVERLKSRHPRICFKPARSVYGIGFFILDESGTNSRPYHLSLGAAIQRLQAHRVFPPHLVMEYLPGPERSVDCLAQAGELIRCVVRRKAASVQWIEHHPLIEEMVRGFTRKFRLNGVLNIQFRDSGGLPRLLEINPRMSGGLPIACAAGVNFLLWAIRLALGSAASKDVPHPLSGICVPQPKPHRSISR
ncbi:MAG: ATP-grasp domain-containing protein [Nitrospira sp.]|nr:ATP-grasp domain-containing protein [Nitrospira sp.]